MAPILVYFALCSISNAQWLMHNNLQYGLNGAEAAGYYNDSIYILDWNHLVRYDIPEDNFTDYGPVLPAYNYLFAGYYSQYDATRLYTLTCEDTGCHTVSVFVFDMTTMEQQKVTTIPVYVSTQGCLASSEVTGNLYVIGGLGDNWGDKIVQIYNFDSSSWSNGSSTNYNRYWHDCIVEPTTQTLYVVGGWYEDAMERINIMNIYNESWEVFGYLPDGPTWSNIRLVERRGIIYIIGGEYYEPFADIVYTINTDTGVVDQFQYSLPYGVTRATTLIVDDIIYVFNPSDTITFSTTEWLSYDFNTRDPTVDPSTSPTKAPTDPTMSPTFDPTNNPSSDPTSSPSADPTTSPSAFPTVYPTPDPSANPTNDPTTASPTDTPTTAVPTQEPTADPTKNPSTDPTTGPTTEPTTEPSTEPTMGPSTEPTMEPSIEPTTEPTVEPSGTPTDVETTEMIEFCYNVVSLHCNHSHNI